MSRKIIPGDKPDRHKKSLNTHRKGRHASRMKASSPQLATVIAVALIIIALVLLFWH